MISLCVFVCCKTWRWKMDPVRPVAVTSVSHWLFLGTTSKGKKINSITRLCRNMLLMFEVHTYQSDFHYPEYLHTAILFYIIFWGLACVLLNVFFGNAVSQVSINIFCHQFISSHSCSWRTAVHSCINQALGHWLANGGHAHQLDVAVTFPAICLVWAALFLVSFNFHNMDVMASIKVHV